MKNHELDEQWSVFPFHSFAVSFFFSIYQDRGELSAWCCVLGQRFLDLFSLDLPEYKVLW